MPAYDQGTKRISPSTNALALASHVDEMRPTSTGYSSKCDVRAWASLPSLIVGVGFGDLAGFAVDHPRRGLVSMPSCRSGGLRVLFEHRHLVGV